jgi:hypothetical protein
LHFLSMLLGLLLHAFYILFNCIFPCVFVCFCSSFPIFYFYVMLDVQMKTNIIVFFVHLSFHFAGVGLHLHLFHTFLLHCIIVA